MYLATFTTPHFTFHVVDGDEQAARHRLSIEWARHAEQTDADPNYLTENADSINIVGPFKLGDVIRDGQVFSCRDCDRARARAYLDLNESWESARCEAHRAKTAQESAA